MAAVIGCQATTVPAAEEGAAAGISDEGADTGFDWDLEVEVDVEVMPTPAEVEVYTIPELRDEIHVHIDDTNPLRVDEHLGTEYSWRGSIDKIMRPATLVTAERSAEGRRIEMVCSFENPEPLLPLNEGDEVVLRGNFGGTFIGARPNAYSFRNCILVSGPE